MSEKSTTEVRLAGDLDLTQWNEVAADLPSPEEFGRVVIDCSTVTSMDSPVIAVLLRYRKSFIEAGNDPLDIVVLASKQVQRLFDIAGVTRLLTVIDSSKQVAQNHR